MTKLGKEEFRRAQARVAKRIKEREAEIAHHEAGHFVVARVLGISITHATMLPDQTSLASVGMEAAYLARNADQMNALVVGSFAGPHAQSRYRPARNADDWERKANDWNGDIEPMSSWAASIVALRHGLPVPEDGAMAPFPDSLKPEVGPLLEQLSDKAEAMVIDSWRAITRVAEALLARRILNQQDVDHLIAEDGVMRSLRRVRRRLHRCYELTFKVMLEEPGAEKFVLVHGYIYIDGTAVGHAWIEIGDGRVYDAVLNRTMPWHEYTAERGAVILLRQFFLPFHDFAGEADDHVVLIGLPVHRDGAECGAFYLHGLILVPSHRAPLVFYLVA